MTVFSGSPVSLLTSVFATVVRLQVGVTVEPLLENV